MYTIRIPRQNAELFAFMGHPAMRKAMKSALANQTTQIITVGNLRKSQVEQAKELGERYGMVQVEIVDVPKGRMAR